MTEINAPIDEQPAHATEAVEISKEPVKPPRRKRPFLIGFVLFLLILLAAAGGAGYWGYGMWQRQQLALTDLQSRVAELDQSLNAQIRQRASSSELSRLAEENQSAQHSVQLAVAGVQAALNEHKQRLDTLSQMMGQDASQWRLSEIERLLSAAQLRIGALDDPLGARQMLREVERLASTLGGESQGLRTAVQQIAGSLDRSVPLDRDGLALKMFNLAQIMPNLPLKAHGGSGVSDNTTADVTTPQTGWWSQTKAWFSGWLTIKNTEQPTTTTPPAHQPAPLAASVQSLLKAREALLTRHVDEAARLSAQALAQAQQVTTLDATSPNARQALAELRDISAALEQGYRPQALDFAPAFVALRALREPPAASTAQPANALPTTPPLTKEP